jgi:hypothetical protein
MRRRGEVAWAWDKQKATTGYVSSNKSWKITATWFNTARVPQKILEKHLGLFPKRARTRHILQRWKIRSIIPCLGPEYPIGQCPRSSARRCPALKPPVLLCPIGQSPSVWKKTHEKLYPPTDLHGPVSSRSCENQEKIIRPLLMFLDTMFLLVESPMVQWILLESLLCDSVLLTISRVWKSMCHWSPACLF